MTVEAKNYLRRGFHYHSQQNMAASFSEYDGSAAIVDSYPNCTDAQLKICDLSVTARSGFKGADTIQWLQQQGLRVQAKPNTVFEQSGGELCAVLAPGEAMIITGFHNGQPTAGALQNMLEKTYSIEQQEACYHVPRQDTHFDFFLIGNETACLFAKVCGVDLRPQTFANFQIAQTSVARSNAVVIRTDYKKTLAFRILGDSASCLYMWDALLDAGAEFGIKAAGISQI